jgi:hypothetical protein
MRRLYGLALSRQRSSAAFSVERQDLAVTSALKVYHQNRMQIRVQKISTRPLAETRIFIGHKILSFEAIFVTIALKAGSSVFITRHQTRE